MIVQHLLVEVQPLTPWNSDSRKFVLGWHSLALIASGGVAFTHLSLVPDRPLLFERNWAILGLAWAAMQPNR